MEIIKKKIYLNTLRNRIPSKLTAYENGVLLNFYDTNDNNWGHFPIDIVVGSKRYDTSIQRYVYFPTPFAEIFGDGADYSWLTSESRVSSIPLSDTIIRDVEYRDKYGQDDVAVGKVLRYGTISEFYGFLIMLINSSVDFYKFCKRKDGYKFVKMDIDEEYGNRIDFYIHESQTNHIAFMRDIPLVDDVKIVTPSEFDAIRNSEEVENGVMYYSDGTGKPDPTQYGFYRYDNGEWCKIIGISSRYDEFAEKFIYNNKKFDYKFYHFVTTLFTKRLSSEIASYIQSVPYIDVSLYLEESASLIGNLLPGVEDWIPGKKYYIGQMVRYTETGDTKGHIYVLEYAQEKEGSGTYYSYDEMEVNSHVYDALKNGDLYRSTSYLTYSPYWYAGHYNWETRVLEFDDPNNPHWKRVDKHIESSPMLVKSYSESKLKENERYVKSFSEDGKRLPFIIIDNSYDTAITYLLGITRGNMDTDGVKCNIMNNIGFICSGTPTDDKIVTIEEYTGNDIESIKDELLDEAYWVKDDGKLKIYIGRTYSKEYKTYFKLSISAFSDLGSTNYYSLMYFSTDTPIAIGFNKLKTIIPSPDIMLSQNTDCIFGVSLDFADNTIKDFNVNYFFRYSTNISINDVMYDILNGSAPISLADERCSIILRENNMVVFDYFIDKSMDGYQKDNIEYDDYTGVRYTESYLYTIDTMYCNYSGQYCWLEVSPVDNAPELDIVPDPSTVEYGFTFKYVGGSVSPQDYGYSGEHSGIMVFRTNAYYRKESCFNFVNIDKDNTYVYTVESGVTHNSDNYAHCEYYGNMLADTFTDIPGYIDESIGGITDIDEDIDVNIQRNPRGIAAFERHFILSEINTFQDLLHYKNNFFKL